MTLAPARTEAMLSLLTLDPGQKHQPQQGENRPLLRRNLLQYTTVGDYIRSYTASASSGSALSGSCFGW